MSAKEIFNDLETIGLTVSTKTVARTLHRVDFGGYRPRKTPLLKPRHLKARLALPKRHLEHDNDYWKSISQIKLKLNHFSTWTHVMFGGKLVKHSTPIILSSQLNMVVRVLCFGVALPFLIQGNLFEFNIASWKRRLSGNYQK